MRKTWKRIAMMSMIGILGVIITGCSERGTGESASQDATTKQEALPADTGSSDSKTAKKPKETTLKIYMFGQSDNQDKVLNKFYELTEDTLNTKLDFVWSDTATHREKVPLMMSNQEEADLVFDAPWMNLTKLRNQGAYAPLTKYFNNDDYPGLKKAFSEDFLKENMDENGDIHMVPFKQGSIDLPCLYIRKDLREKYGMNKINSNDELEEFFINVQQDIANGSLDMMAPFGISGSRSFLYLDSDIIDKANNNVYEIAGTSTAGVGLEMEVALSEDGKTVLGAATVGEPDSAYADFPAPFNKNTRSERIIDDLTKWAKYVQSDPQTETDAKNNLFFPGKVAAFEANLSNYTAVKEAIEKIGGEIEIYFYLPEMREQKPFTTYISLSANNFLCVPQQSKKIDEAMKFIDWIFQSQENHDLFELGIEGEDWKAVGTDEYETIRNEKSYTFPGYELTWNPNYTRIDTSLPDEIKQYVKYQNAPDTYLPNQLYGFQFNADANAELRNAFAAVAAVQSEYHPLLMKGLLKTPEEAEKVLADYNTKIKSAGIDIIRAEVIRQVQEHLNNIYQ